MESNAVNDSTKQAIASKTGTFTRDNETLEATRSDMLNPSSSIRSTSSSSSSGHAAMAVPLASSSYSTAPETLSSSSNLAVVSLLDKYSNLQSDREAVLQQIQAAQWHLEETKAKMQDSLGAGRDWQQQTLHAEQGQVQLEAQLQAITRDQATAQVAHDQATQALKLSKLQEQHTRETVVKARTDFIDSVQDLEQQCHQLWKDHSSKQKEAVSKDELPSSQEGDGKEQDASNENQEHDPKHKTKKLPEALQSVIDLCEQYDDDQEDEDLQALTYAFQKKPPPPNPDDTELSSTINNNRKIETETDGQDPHLMELKDRYIPLLAFALVEERHSYSKKAKELVAVAKETLPESNRENQEPNTSASQPCMSDDVEKEQIQPSSNTDDKKTDDKDSCGTPSDWIAILRARLQEDSQEEVAFDKIVAQLEEQIASAQEGHDAEQASTLDITKEHDQGMEKRTQQRAQIKQLESQLDRMLRDVDSLEDQVNQVQSDIAQFDAPNDSDYSGEGEDDEDSHVEDADEEEAAIEEVQRKRKRIVAAVDRRVRQAVLPGASIPAAQRQKIHNPYLRKASKPKPGPREEALRQRCAHTAIDSRTVKATAITPGSSAKKKRSKKQHRKRKQANADLEEQEFEDGREGASISKTSTKRSTKKTKVSSYFSGGSKTSRKKSSSVAKSSAISKPVHDQPTRNSVTPIVQSSFSVPERQYPHRVGRMRPCKDFGISLSLNSLPLQQPASVAAAASSSLSITKPWDPNRGHAKAPPPAPIKKARSPKIVQPILHNRLLDDDRSSSSSSSSSKSSSSSSSSQNISEVLSLDE